MTPAARLSAAIGILDQILAGAPAEQALTNWARASRFAGSGDRHAIRDLVFEAIRCKRSFSSLGGAETGRGLILGGLRSQGIDAKAFFTGDGHAPPALAKAELAPAGPMSELDALDCPDWLAPRLRASLGSDFMSVMRALRLRAPVFLRVNATRMSRDEAAIGLAAEGVATRPSDLAKNALEVTENARKIQSTQCYLNGTVELQDAASQAVIDALPLRSGQRVLDYCAGGGGKSLGMAARADVRLFVHDANPQRMRDLPSRAERAGVRVKTLATNAVAASGPYDLVLADVPCSGSGSWRRAPEAKWAFSEARLAELCAVQAEILNNTQTLVSPGGALAYATCSLLKDENDDQIAAFLDRFPEWSQSGGLRLTPMDGGDGFFLAILTRNQ